VGQYRIQTGTDPVYGFPILEHHGFVATPAEPLTVSQKKE
jgi:hypothetical protein